MSAGRADPAPGLPLPPGERRASAPGRLRGVDVARALALLGMMTVHLLPAERADGTTSAAYLVFSGRAAALFAVLAGVGLALASGGSTPPRGRRWAAGSAALLVRAAVLLPVGLLVIEPTTPVAVILPYYAVLFVVAVPLLPLNARWAAGAAAAVALLAPLVSHVLRLAGGLSGPGPQPQLEALLRPAHLAETLLLTGYYPVLPWTAYLLAGIAVGRTGLRSPGLALRLLGAGLVLAAAGKAVSRLLLASGGYERLAASVPPLSSIEFVGLDVALERSLYGTTPTTSWWWLAVAAPHSSTPFDLAHTIGTSLAVLGACLLAVPALERWGRALVVPLAAAGSMTLTLYCLHVLTVTREWGPQAPADLLAVHAVTALAVAAVWRTWARRGPLEAGVAALSGAASAVVLGPGTPTAPPPPHQAPGSEPGGDAAGGHR